MGTKWFYCPVCGYKIGKTNENSKGGTFVPCRYHKGIVEIKHQTNLEQQEILSRIEKIKELKQQIWELQSS